MNLRILFLFCILASQQAFSQNILFREDFDSCALSDQWTYTLTGNQDVAWGVGFPTNPKAEGLSINGSCFLYIDDDLTGDKTPPFTLRVVSDYFNGQGYSDISLQAQVHFRRDKTEVMRLIIDNGNGEHVVREFKGRNYSGDKFSQYVDIRSDISYFASDSMRLIIEYVDNNEWGWWAGIDNIVITGNETGEIILGQTFNDCAKPADWQTEIVNGLDDWQFGVFTDGRTMDGTCFTYFNDDALGENRPLSKIRLFSPVFNGETFGSYKLIYDFIFRTYEPSEYLQLYVDNGKEWIPVKTYNGDVAGPNVDENTKEIIDLSPYRSETMRLIWEYNDGGWAWWLGMDNVKVVGQGNINDKCNKALPLITDDTCLPYDNTNALVTDEFGINQPLSTGKMYFSWTPANSGKYDVITNSEFNDVIEVFRGDCNQPELLNTVNKDEYGFKGETSTVDVIGGQSYIIRISGTANEFGLDKGTGCIAVKQHGVTIQAPSNDLCLQSIPLQTNISCSIGQNIVATLDGPLPSLNKRSRADVWFSFIPEADGDYIFESKADFADVITVFKGNCAQLTEIMADFNGQQCELNRLSKDSLYFIQVTGYFSLLEGHLCGSVRSKNKDSVTNTNCVTAQVLMTDGSCQSHSNQNAGFSGVRPFCDVTIENDVWFTFTAPPSGKIYFRAKTEFQHLLAVYEGNCAKLTSIYCQKNNHHCAGYQKLEGLTAGNVYFIQIGSERGKKSGSFCLEITAEEPEHQNLVLSVTQECKSRGAVQFYPDATGGLAPYTYYGQGLNVPVAGNDIYYIEVTDGEGCVQTQKINANTCLDFGCSLASQFTPRAVTCPSGNDGRIEVTTSGGLPPYQYTWSNGSYGAVLENVGAGLYQVTITDASGCVWTDETQIYQPAAFSANPVVTAPPCYGDSTGLVEILPIGGSGNYTFLWSEGSTTQNLTEVPGGNYRLSVTDEAGCVYIENIVIQQPEEIVIEEEITHNPCFGGLSGIIRLSAKGGTGTLSYLWSNGEETDMIIYLKAGTYQVTVVDENLCMTIKEYVITQPDSLVMVAGPTNLEITDSKDAEISVMVSGGTQPYTYVWFHNQALFPSDTNYISTREPGVYHVVVTDVNGCTVSSQTWTVFRTSSTDQENVGQITLFPNPTKREITLTSTNGKTIEGLSIRDVTGKTVLVSDQKYTGGKAILDVSFLPSGVYHIHCHQEDTNIILPFVKVD